MIDFLIENRNIAANIFGFAAIVVAIIMYQFKNRKAILWFMVLYSALWCCHFGILGLATPVAMNLLNTLRSFVFSFRDKKWAQSNLIPAGFLTASVIMVICTWESVWSILPVIGTAFATIGNWQQDTKRLKILTVPVCLTWFTYNTVNHSIPGMINETLAFSSIIVSFIRTYKKKKQLTK